MATVERFDQGCLIDHAATRCVDEESIPFHCRETLFVKKMRRLRAHAQMDGDRVRFGQVTLQLVGRAQHIYALARHGGQQPDRPHPHGLA